MVAGVVDGTRLAVWNWVLGIGLIVLGVGVRAGEGREPRGPEGEAVVRLKGIVRDDEAQPLAGVTVRLYADEWGPERDTAALAGEVTTGEDGRFRFPEVPAPVLDREKGIRRIYHVVAARPGLSTEFDRVTPISPPNVDVELTLGPPGTLRGRVTDTDGNPVAGALVYGYGMGSGSSLIQGVRNTRTDEEGRYAIEDFAAFQADLSKRIDGRTGKVIEQRITSILFRVRHRDYGLKTASYVSIPSTVDVTLERAAVIEGRVMDGVTGRPAARVRVMAQNLDSFSETITRTDAEGRYRLEMLCAGQFNIAVAAPGRTAAAMGALWVVAGETKPAPDIELVEGGWIVGRVVDHATGEPVSRRPDGGSIEVDVRGPSTPEIGFAPDSVIVDADGGYRIRVAPGDNLARVRMLGLTAERADGQTEDTPVVVGEGETVRVDFRVRAGD